MGVCAYVRVRARVCAGSPLSCFVLVLLNFPLAKVHCVRHWNFSYNPVSFALMILFPPPHPRTGLYSEMLVFFISLLKQGWLLWKAYLKSFLLLSLSLSLQHTADSQQVPFFVSLLPSPLTFLYTCFSHESLRATGPSQRRFREGERTCPREGASRSNVANQPTSACTGRRETCILTEDGTSRVPVVIFHICTWES